MEACTCAYCGDVLATPFILKQHMSYKHSERLPFSCELCGKGFISYSGLRHHKRTHLGWSFPCEFCGAKFKHKHHMKDHVKKFHSQFLNGGT